jgi:hypothetical protein
MSLAAAHAANDLRAGLRARVGFRCLAALGALGLGFLVFFVSAGIPPHYEAEATVLAAGSREGGGVAELLASPDLARRVARRLSLRTADFGSSAPLLRTVLSALGLETRRPDASDEAQVVDALLDRLTVAETASRGVFAVRFRAEDAGAAAAVANAVAADYVATEAGEGGGVARIVTEARRPAAPTFPRPMLNATVVALTAFAAALLFASERSRHGRRLQREAAAPSRPPRPLADFRTVADDGYPVPLRALHARIEAFAEGLPEPESEPAPLAEPRRVAGARLGVLGAEAGTARIAADALAVEMSESGDRIVVVHLHGADPATTGLAELLAGDAAFGDIIRREAGDRWHVIEAGGRAFGGGESGGEAFAGVLTALGDTYDLVILDLGDAAAGLELAACCDHAMIAGAPEEAEALERQLAAAGVASVSFMGAAAAPLAA